MDQVSGMPESAATATAQARADWVREFIYGTIAALIAMAGFESVGEGEPIAAAAIVAVSALATWCAHAYSEVLGHRLGHGRPVSVGEITRALRSAWPIVVAAVPATFAASGATLGWWSLDTAIRAADIAGIVVMSIAGFAAAKVTGASKVGVIVWVVATAGIGAAIIVVELAVHH